jgi:hypothetical protein
MREMNSMREYSWWMRHGWGHSESEACHVPHPSVACDVTTITGTYYDNMALITSCYLLT